MGRKAPSATAIPSEKEILGNPAVPVVGKENNSKRILAFDISSSCVGWAVGVNGDIRFYGRLVFKSTATVGEKLAAFEEFLFVLLKAYDPHKVIVEKTVSRRGVTTLRHAELFGVLRKVWYQHKKEEIKPSWIISAITIKKALDVKSGRDHSHNKEIMVNRINDLLNISLACDSSKLRSEDDVADAIAVLLTYYYSLKKK